MLASLAAPIATRSVAACCFIPTRRVSEELYGIFRPSLTLRVVMFSLHAANLLTQQAGERGKNR
jgi:hypothetical protein